MIGDADVRANQVEVSAKAKEAVFTVTANASVAGAAGVGGAVSVNTVSNTTMASIAAGADIDASGNLTEKAVQDTALDLFTMSGAGGIAGVSGAVAVAVVDNTTHATIDGSERAANGAKVNADGTIEVSADAKEDINTVTVSAAGGGVGVAGALAVKVLKSETTAGIGKNAQINQAANGVIGQNVKVTASDDIALTGGSGSGAAGGFAGVGATADINIVRNTTAASVGDAAQVEASNDIVVEALAQKNVQAAATAAAGGGSAGIAGAVAVLSLGAKLDSESQSNLGGGKSASYADEKIKQDQVSGQLGNSEHVQMAKRTTAAQSASQSVASDMNSTSTSSLDKTQAALGSGAKLKAGNDVRIAAGDKVKARLDAVGFAVGTVGLGGAVGVAVTNSTTEAITGTGSSIEAGNKVDVSARSSNVDGTGVQVNALAGAGGLVGAVAAVAVADDTSVTRAVVGDYGRIDSAKTVKVAAETDRKAVADTKGGSAGWASIGASMARAQFAGRTEAKLGANTQIGKTAAVGAFDLTASDSSSAKASALAGAAGVLAGSGADAKATVSSHVEASSGSGSAIAASDDVSVLASATPQAEANALGVNLSVGGSVGASLADARSATTVIAALGSANQIDSKNLNVKAARKLGAAPSALAKATGASGGLLLGVNATVAKAESTGVTSAQAGVDSTLSRVLSRPYLCEVWRAQKS